MPSAVFCQEKKAGKADGIISAGDALAKDGQYKEALEKYNEALKIEPENADYHYKKGVACYFLKDYDEAIAEYKKALEYNPGHYKAYNNLGLTYMMINENVRATECFMRALDIEPGYGKARYNLGVVLLKREKLQEAEIIVRDYIVRYPESSGAYLLLGLILERKQNYIESLDCIKKSLAINPSNETAAEAEKRVAPLAEMLRAELAELEKVRNVVNFELPEGYRFYKMYSLKSGVKVIVISVREKTNLYIAKFPDAYSLKSRDIATLLRNQDEAFMQLMHDMSLSDLMVIDVCVFERDVHSLDEAGVEKQEGNFNREYARIKAMFKDRTVNGLVSLQVQQSTRCPILVFVFSSAGSTKTSDLYKFLKLMKL